MSPTVAGQFSENAVLTGDDRSGGQVQTDQQFGGCPHCGKTDGYINIGNHHFLVCDRHMARWWIGYGMFSSWMDETEEQQQINRKKLSCYADVEPIYPVDEMHEEGLDGISTEAAFFMGNKIAQHQTEALSETVATLTSWPTHPVSSTSSTQTPANANVPDDYAMSETLEPVTTDEHFGGCPHCGKTDGYINIGRDHHFLCDAHLTRWYAGSGLFSSHWDETEEDLKSSLEKMERYKPVRAIYPVEVPKDESRNNVVWLSDIRFKKRIENGEFDLDEIPF